jgi:hypothetical protein
MRPLRREERSLWDPLTRGWQLVVAFFLGTLVSVVDFDLADYVLLGSGVSVANAWGFARHVRWVG